MNYNLNNEIIDDMLLLSQDSDNLTAGGYTNAVVAGLGGNDAFQTAGTGGTFAASAFSGGEGNDRLIVKANDTVVGTNLYNGGTGTDSLELSSNAGPITMSASALGTTVSIGSTGSIVASGVERFVIYGSEGSDAFIGSAGDDLLDGRAGVDTYQGSAGNDAYVLSSSEEFVAGEDQGTDTIWSSASADLGRSAGVENLRLQGFGEIDGTGNVLNNLITGNGAGNVIAGGLGRDQLWGKGGADTFVFDQAGSANRDSVFDFDQDDQIKLDAAAFDLDAVNGKLAASDFVRGVKATADHAQVIYNTYTGVLSYDADGRGAGVAQEIAFIGKNLAFFDNADILVG